MQKFHIKRTLEKKNDYIITKFSTIKTYAFTREVLLHPCSLTISAICHYFPRSQVEIQYLYGVTLCTIVQVYTLIPV